MTIIEHGNKRQYHGVCIKCGTVYSYKKSDYFEIVEERPGAIVREEYHLFRKTEKYREIMRCRYKGLKCPVCGYVKKETDIEHVFGEHVRWEKIEE